MARIMYVLTREEVQTGIAYQLICTTMSSAIWQTSKRRRRWAEEFTESERRACNKLGRQAHSWYLTTGIPEEVTMAAGTLALWKKLEAFCASL